MLRGAVRFVIGFGIMTLWMTALLALVLGVTARRFFAESRAQRPAPRGSLRRPIEQLAVQRAVVPSGESSGAVLPRVEESR